MPERRERQRQRAKRERRELGDAHLQDRPVAAPDERQHARSGSAARAIERAGVAAALVSLDAPRRWRAIASRRVRSRGSRGGLAVFALVQRARLRHPAVAPDAARETRAAARRIRRCRARSSARSADSVVDAELVQHPLEHGPDADDQLEVVGRAGAVEQRRRRVVLEVDDELAVARGFAARVGELAEQARGARRRSRELRSVPRRASRRRAASARPRLRSCG